jgi:colicin import membrane protein
MSIERKSDKWISLTQSALLHAVVVGALAYGFYAYKTRPPQEQKTLALEAAAVDSAGAPIEAPKQPDPPPPAPEPEPEPQPEPPPPEEQGPPAPTPEEIQQREQAEREEQEKVEQQQREQERVAQERQQAEQRVAAEEKARKEDDERKRKEEERAAEQKRLADERRKAEEKRKADEEKRRRDLLAREQSERDAELRRSLEAEERQQAARTSDAYAAWTNQIIARVKRAWTRPPNTPVGLTCTVRMSQTSGGEVVSVDIGDCNGDAVVQESIRSAVFKASPLPPPPDPSLFERNITFVFRHNE